MHPSNEEIEVVFLEIDQDDMERRLAGIGAEKVGDYRKIAFDGLVRKDAAKHSTNRD
ncbi:MAG: hypothetical protein HGA33_04085 [Candidatus Moranbacteria bacterium]|nr:hypothetical protein [Candidatus Moranbacteria bacterium]